MPSTAPRHPRALPLAVAAALASVAASACSSSTTPDGPTGQITTPTSQVRTAGSDPRRPSPEAEVKAAYLAALVARTHALTGARGGSDELTQTRSGQLLTTTRAELADLTRRHRQDRMRNGRPPRYDVTGLQVTGTGSATGLSCVVDDLIEVELPSNRVTDGATTSFRYRGSLRLMAGRWKLVKLDLLNRWPDGGGCAR